jgi:thiamine transport system permease protein
LVRISSLVFLLCAASFVIVLTLGGGPSATTLEVAIYQSLRVDFDVARAISLSFMQILLCGTLVVLAGKVITDISPATSLRLRVVRYDGHSVVTWLLDAFMLAAAAVLIVPPLIAIIAAGAAGLEQSKPLMVATLTSLSLALAAAFFCVILAWPIARKQTGSMRVISLAGLIVPPAVLATGWFVAFKGWEGGIAQALLMITVLNALMALPFAVSALAPALAQFSSEHERLCWQLGVVGLSRLTVIDIPAMRRPLLQALLMAFVLSLGDLTAITLLGTQGLVTLPSLIAQQMGSYRGGAAGGTALVLAVLCYGLTLMAQRAGRVA